jgi:hypothetical protein
MAQPLHVVIQNLATAEECYIGKVLGFMLSCGIDDWGSNLGGAKNVYSFITRHFLILIL